MSYSCSNSGWITTDLFESWLCDHPLLLLLDGHSTHYQLELIRNVRQKKVLVLCLPPHMTQAQPLDCAVFSPLKAQWRAVCHEFFQGKVINNFNFVILFTKAGRKLSLLLILELVLRLVAFINWILQPFKSRAV